MVQYPSLIIYLFIFFNSGVEERVSDPDEAGPRLEFVGVRKRAPSCAQRCFSGLLYQAAILLYISSNFGAEGSGSARENQRRAGGGGGGCSAVAFCADSFAAQSTHVGRGFFHCFPTNMLRGRAWPQCLHLFCVPDSV